MSCTKKPDTNRLLDAVTILRTPPPYLQHLRPLDAKIKKSFIRFCLMEHSTYPVTLLPQRLKQAQDSKPTIPNFDRSPPIHPGPSPAPAKKSAILVESSALLIPGVVISSQPQARMVGLGVVAAGLLAIFWRSLGRFRRFQQRKSFYTEKFQQYTLENKDYNLAKEQYISLVEKIKSLDNIATYKRQKITEVLHLTEAPNADETGVKEGASESYFYKYLIQYFGDKIAIQKGFDRPIFTKPCTPDFIYHDPTINLYIDIEIDEPYTLKGGKPIHGTDTWWDGTRDDHFLGWGWVVIHFSEEQVVRWPRSCCKHIAITVDSLSGIVDLENFKDVNNLGSMPRWSEAEAKVMAINKTRNCYLKLIE